MVREPEDGEFAAHRRERVAAGISTRRISVVTAEEEQTDRPRYAFLAGMVPLCLTQILLRYDVLFFADTSFMGFD